MKRLRFTIIMVVVLLVGGVAALVARSMWQQRRALLLSTALEILPGVSQHIRDFRRVKVQDGRKVWEVAAKDGQYFEEERMVVVRGAVMEWYLDDGRVVGLRGEEARILIDGREVSHVELKGDIQVSLADYTVRTERASYDNERRMIEAPGAVRVTGRTLELEGEGLQVDVEGQRLSLLRNVSMQLVPPAARRGVTDVRG